MKKNAQQRSVGTITIVFALVTLAFITSVVRADSVTEGDDRVGTLSWPGGKEHPWLDFMVVDGYDVMVGKTRRGPSQGKAEYLRVEQDQRNTYKTIVFLVAYDHDHQRPYVVVPGFKVEAPSVNKHGVPTMRVVRVGRLEQIKILAALAKELATRGLGSAPVNFWF